MAEAVNWAEYERLYREPLSALAALDDDHATKSNMVGFSAADGPFAHSLVNQSRAWSPKQTAAAYKILRRYSRTQLPELGFDFDTLPPCPDPATAKGTTIPARNVPTATATLHGTYIHFAWSFGGGFNDRVMAVKGLAGRTWNAEGKYWSVPLTMKTAPSIVAMLHDLNEKGFGFTEAPDLRPAIDTVVERGHLALMASQAADADITISGLRDNAVLRPFQKAGVAYAIQNPKTIIGDDMGLGKTLMSIATMTTAKRQRVLIVCPASLKLNWLKEIEQWVGPMGIEILEGKKPRALYRTRWTIINYDLLADWAPVLSKEEFDAVIADEAHMLKSGRKSQRGQAFEQIVQQVKPENVLLLTGTPMLNRPIELWPLLKVIDGDGKVGGWRHFTQHYCGATHTGFGMDLNGASNLAELNTVLRSGGMMLRRRKSEVLQELPDRLWSSIPMQMSGTESRAYRKMWAAALESQTEGAMLQAIGEARQMVAAAKLRQVGDYIKAFLDADEQVVVFAWHREIAEQIAHQHNAPLIIGGMKRADIERGKAAFQSGEHKVIVCNIAAGGVGHTLTAASNVLFVEQAWNGALMDQALDRAHRIGQQADKVTGWVMSAELDNGEPTIDAYMFNMIQSKRAVTTEGVDGRAQVDRWIPALQRVEQEQVEAEDWDDVA